MQPIAIVMVGSYFDKRRGFANSIAVSGGSLGGLILAPLLTTLFENYGYSGAMLIVSAVFLNGWVTGALFRSQTFYTDRQKLRHKSENDFINENSNIKQVNNGSAAMAINGNPKILINGNLPRYLFLKRQTSLDMPESPTSPLSLVTVEEVWSNNGRIRAETFSEGDNFKNRTDSPVTRRLKSQMDKPHSGSSISLILDKISDSKVAKYASSEFIAGSMLDIPYIEQKTKVSDPISDANKSKERISIFKTILKVFDFSLFKNPVFITFLIAAGLLCAANALIPVYLAPHARENGISDSDIATLYTIFSAIDFCSRILVGIVSDKGWLRRSTIIGISASIIGITAHLVRFYSSYGWLLSYAVILGLFSGVHFSLFAVVIVDYLTLPKLQSCLGFTTLSHGAAVSCSFALIGMYFSVFKQDALLL